MTSETRGRPPLRSVVLLILPTAVALAAVLVLTHWRIPTRVSVDVTASRTVFTVGGDDSIALLSLVPFRAITVEKFARVSFSPVRLRVLDPAWQTQPTEHAPESAWRPLTLISPVSLTGEDEALQPAVTFESASTGQDAEGTAGPLWTRPGADVAIEVRNLRTGDLTIRVDHQPSSVTLSFRQRFSLIARYTRVSGITDPLGPDSLTYRGWLPEAAPHVEVTSQPRSVVISLTVSPETGVDLLPKAGIPVTAVSFARQGLTGAPATALTSDGEISYPDYAGARRVSFKATEFIELHGLERFRIDDISAAPPGKGLRFRLTGVAGHVRTGSPGFPEDHRLTRFDALRQSPGLVALFSVAVWVFPTTIGAYRLYREVMG